jgi:uncharacterized membrane protein
VARESHHRWLHEQLPAWREEGIVDAETATRIGARHPAEPERPGAPLLLFVGAGLVGIGVIWLVASNLEIDEIGPLQRCLGVAAVWLALVAAGEALAGRERWDMIAGPVRLIAALAYGGTIFQAAQSLQVPAYAPELLLAWGLGALAYAYAVRARGALVVGVAALAGFYMWAMTDTVDDGGTAFILAMGLACPVAAALAALQPEDFGGPWRFVAAALGLLALGVAAVPEAADGEFPSLLPAAAGAVLAAGLSLVAYTLTPGERREVLGAAAIGAVTVVLMVLAPDDAASFGTSDRITGAQTAYTLLACALFLAGAVGVALAGVTRGQGSLTNLAYAALLLFLAVQSFGALATLTSGAVLVLGVGAVMLVAGIVLDRGRRRLIEEAG